MMRMAYSYVALRYIHDVMTGEFANIGMVMLVPDQSLLLTRFNPPTDRITSFFPDLDHDAYRTTIKNVERGFESVSKSIPLRDDGQTAGYYARKVIPDDDSSLQWSHTGSGVTEDTAKTFVDLFKRFVTRYDNAPGARRRAIDAAQPA